MHRFAAFILFMLGFSLLACNFAINESPAPTATATPTAVRPTQTAIPELPFESFGVLE